MQLCRQKRAKLRLFKGSGLRWMAYLIAHDFQHRGSILLTLKQNGMNLPKEVALELWLMWYWGEPGHRRKRSGPGLNDKHLSSEFRLTESLAAGMLTPWGHEVRNWQYKAIVVWAAVIALIAIVPSVALPHLVLHTASSSPHGGRCLSSSQHFDAVSPQFSAAVLSAFGGRLPVSADLLAADRHLPILLCSLLC
jgi:hypothetical protein